MMLAYMLVAIGLLCCLALVPPENDANGNQSCPDFPFSAHPCVWCALILAAMVVFHAHLGELSWLTVLLTPPAFLLIVGVVWTAGYELMSPSWRKRGARFAPYALTLCLASLAGYFIWTCVPGEPCVSSQFSVPSASENSPYANRTVRLAESRKAKIESARDAMTVTLVSMSSGIEELKRPLASESYTLAEIGETAKELLHMADMLIEQHTTLLEHYDEFKDWSSDGPELFREAAAVWREKGLVEQEVGYRELAETYEETAQLWDAYADFIEATQEKPLNIDELNEAMCFVYRGRELLGMLAAHADALPDVSLLEQHARLEANLRRFIQRFDQLRSSIQGLTGQLREGADAVQEVDPSQLHDETTDRDDRTAGVLPRIPAFLSSNSRNSPVPAVASISVSQLCDVRTPQSHNLSQRRSLSIAPFG